MTFINIHTRAEAEQFLMLAFSAFTDSVDGMEPKYFDEAIKSDFHRGSIETVARVIAFALAETIVCDEGLGIGDVVVLIHDDLTDAARLVAHGRHHNADAICKQAAKRFLDTLAQPTTKVHD